MANGIVAASRFTAETLIENGIAAQRVHIVPYGVDADIFCAEPCGNRVNKPLRVAFVGNLEQRKGVSYLLEAIRLCDPTLVSLVVCSRSHPRPCWQDKLPPNCEFHIGRSRTKMIRVLRSCDLLALPSLIEGFGHVILEAMSLGLPVIATAHTGARDVIREGIDGFVVPIRDPRALAGRFEWALGNSASLKELKAQASARAREFSWESFRAEIRNAYDRMVSDRDLDDGN